MRKSKYVINVDNERIRVCECCFIKNKNGLKIDTSMDSNCHIECKRCGKLIRKYIYRIVDEETKKRKHSCPYCC
jgi:hypothetical protein